jgi:hypothetical protein
VVTDHASQSPANYGGCCSWVSRPPLSVITRSRAAGVGRHNRMGHGLAQPQIVIPRMRGIQYAAASRLDTTVSGILDRPVIGGRKRRRPSDGYAGRRQRCFQTWKFIPATRCARGLPRSFTHLEIRGRGECRMRAAPAVSRAICAKKRAHEHTGSAEALRHSLRNGFTAYIALTPEYRAFLPPSPANMAARARLG